MIGDGLSRFSQQALSRLVMIGDWNSLAEKTQDFNHHQPT